MVSKGLWLMAMMASLWTHQALAADCDPSDREHFICGLFNAEDLVAIDGGANWVAASGMVVGKTGKGHLYLVNRGTKAVTDVDFAALDKAPDKTTYPDCPGPPAPETFNTHGLWYRPGKAGTGLLYAVSHGGRESIEIFQVAATAEAAKLTWIGCAVVPGGKVYLDGVAGTPEGGFVVSSLYDPTIKLTAALLDTGTVRGTILEWRPGSGFQPVPGGDLVTPNGIEISPDGKYLYVAGWTSRSVTRLSRGAATVTEDVIPTNFMPDNMRFAPDGTLYAAGQATTVTEMHACFISADIRCTSPWATVNIDSDTLGAKEVVRRGAGALFGSATTALVLGDEIWLGTVRGDRIARMTPADLAAP